MPREDPYLRDRNMRDAASLQLVGGTLLGALLGFAVAGWFEFSTILGAGAGAAIAFVLASAAVFQYGGRATR
jgi:hypothetical protein